MATDYINQAILATCLIEPKDNDSFYNPTTMGHTGFAWDGTLYNAGVQVIPVGSPPLSPPVPAPVYASWYTEAVNGATFRGDTPTFPQAGLILLSRVSLTILDETSSALTMWMQFLFQNNIIDPDSSPPQAAGSYALTDNFNSELNSWLLSGLAYADGVLSVICTPDYGNKTGITTDETSYNIDSNMIINIDFTQDSVYLDVGVLL